MKFGISFIPKVQIVFQNDGLIDYFTVAENMFIPEQVFRPFPFLGKKKIIAQAGDFIEKNGFSIDPLRPYNSLTMSEKVVIEFLRCVYRNPDILILDESLEKLSGSDLIKVIKLLKKLANSGMAIICISHRIDDIYNIAKRVAVIRDGKILLTDATKNIDRLNLIKMCYTQVSRNKQAEDINKEFYQLLRYNEAILKNLPICLIVTGDQNNIKMINDMGQNFFSLTSEQYTNQPMSSVITDPEAIQNIQQCFNKTTESSLFNQHIADIIVNIKIYPIFDETFPIGNITIIEDITKQEQLRQRINLSENLASLGLLAAGVAHEINNPLEIIYNYLSFLRMNPDHDQAMNAVKQLEEEIDGIKYIVSNLVSFSGNKSQGSEFFDINSLITQTLTLLSPAAKEQEIICSFIAETDEISIYANKTEIRQVLLNLIKNSFEVLTKGGKLQIHTRIHDKTMLLSVKDNGPGISSEIAEQIFLPFYSTKKQSNSNIGLGLPISYSIIKNHNGQLKFKNNNGSEFTVSLPLANIDN
ncbi:MAG: hypothetical protein JEZ01_21265 [Labilibaculum sp.]|nr:ATP-binding protein [Labilibaculum sp.]MBI9060311.1 hypothetical protein [Labilibaculum sp.]